MSEKTGISWTDHTFNPWWGCTKVSPGCKNCYAETFSARYGHDIWGPGKERRTFGAKHWAEPMKWDDAAARDGVRRRVFCASMADVFDPEAPAEERALLWPLIRLTPNLDWLLLTKRPELAAGMLPKDWGDGYPNVWLGTSVENQEYADERIPVLLNIPARIRFLSVEPLLGPVDLSRFMGAPGPDGHCARCGAVTFDLEAGDHECPPGFGPTVDWVIVGGESGANRRPMQLEWASAVKHLCDGAGVAFWFKQIGAFKSGQGEDALGKVYHELPAVAR